MADYKKMTDEELREIWLNDPDAWYEWYLRHRDARTIGAAKTCGNRADDVDYYGSPEARNR